MNKFRYNNIQGKTIVITGASSGAGLAIALALGKEGANLVLAARREEALESAATECRQYGASVITVKTDVTDAFAVQELAREAIEWKGRIDVWVNNAGVLAAGGFSETPVEVHDQVIRTNLMGYLHGAHAVVPYFKKQQSGILINNISVGGWLPTPYAVGYSASKFGLRGFSEALRGELSKWPDIHVCNLFPAFLDTPGIQHAGNHTGQFIRPAPPIYDPQKVARAVVRMVNSPKRSTTVGSMATFLRISHFFFPALSVNITARAIEAYLKVAEPTPATNGNLFEPLEFGTSVHGGWNKPPVKRGANLGGLALLGGLAFGWLLARRR
jgi:short-subunit dehydrogenase